MVVTLPDDLVRDVLERSPVKSLVRFKSVQRSWNALFKTHNFVSRHRQRQRHGSCEHLMIFESFPNMIPHIRLLFCNELPHFEIQDLQHPFPSSDNSDSLVNILSYGLCNGVFCIKGFFKKGISQIILWNPATKEVKVIPPPPNEPSSGKYYVYCGFGADPNTLNDFKIVNFYLIFDNEIGLLPPLAEVYNLNANSWTVIHDDYTNDIMGFTTTTTGLLPFYNSALANGVCHWLSWDCTYILCFDFRYNQFRKLNTPPIATSLGGLIVEANDDSIAYVAYDYLSGYFRIEIWILKHDSWTKTYNIEPLNLGVHVYAIWKDGAEFLGGSFGQSLVLYNSDGQPMHRLQIYPYYNFFIHKYVESMAPLSIN